MPVIGVDGLFHGLYSLLGLGTGSVVSRIAHSGKEQEYQEHVRKLEKKRIEEENAQKAWYDRVIDDSLEYQIRLALLRGEQWAHDEVKELVGDRKNPYLYNIYMHTLEEESANYEKIFQKKITEKTKKKLLGNVKWNQEKSLDVLLANRGKLRREYALKGIMALGGMNDAEDLKLREQHIEFVMFLDSLMKQHGITENLTFRDWYGNVSPPGCRLGNPGVYTYHPEFILFKATDPTKR